MVFAQVPVAAEPRALTLLERGIVTVRHRPTDIVGRSAAASPSHEPRLNPRIILADDHGEPRHQNRRERQLLVQLNQDEGRTIVAVSHDPSITDYATRSLHLLDGRLTDSVDHNLRRYSQKVKP